MNNLTPTVFILSGSVNGVSGYMVVCHNKLLGEDGSLQNRGDVSEGEMRRAFMFDSKDKAHRILAKYSLEIPASVCKFNTYFNEKGREELSALHQFNEEYDKAIEELSSKLKKMNIQTFLNNEFYFDHEGPSLNVYFPYMNYDNIRETNFFENEDYCLSIATINHPETKQKSLIVSMNPRHPYKRVVCSEEELEQMVQKVVSLPAMLKNLGTN